MVMKKLILPLLFYAIIAGCSPQDDNHTTCIHEALTCCLIAERYAETRMARGMIDDTKHVQAQGYVAGVWVYLELQGGRAVAMPPHHKIYKMKITEYVSPETYYANEFRGLRHRRML